MHWIHKDNIVEAILFTEEIAKDALFNDKLGPFGLNVSGDFIRNTAEILRAHVTMSDGQRALVGQWIVKRGDKYCCYGDECFQKTFHPVHEPLPDWAARHSNGSYTEIGAHLATRDVRKCGNAVVTGAEAGVITCSEYGNTRTLTISEAVELFFQPKYIAKDAHSQNRLLAEQCRLNTMWKSVVDDLRAKLTEAREQREAVDKAHYQNHDALNKLHAALGEGVISKNGNRADALVDKVIGRLEHLRLDNERLQFTANQNKDAVEVLGKVNTELRGTKRDLEILMTRYVNVERAMQSLEQDYAKLVRRLAKRMRTK